MPEMTLKIVGDVALKRKFDLMPMRVQNRLMDHALAIGCQLVEFDAIRLAPEKSGALKKSIKMYRVHKRAYMGYRVEFPTRIILAGAQPTYDKAMHVLDDQGYYPAALEYGTAKMPARPFIRPALANNRNAVARLVENDIQNAVRAAMENDVSPEGEHEPLAPDSPDFTGPRGGKYRLSKSGKKVYHR